MSQKLKLLLAEDSDADALALLEELANDGFELAHRRVRTELELRTALDEDHWDAVIVDCVLRDGDGRRLLRALRERSYPGAILAVSGTLDEEQLVEVIHAGAHDFILKSRLNRLGTVLRRELAEAADRSAQRHVEGELRQSDDRLRGVLQNMPVMLIAFGAERQIVVWNRECERVTGFPASEIVGRADALERLLPQVYDRQRFVEWARGDDAYRDREMLIRGKDGIERAIAWSSVAGAFPVPGWASWVIGSDVSQRRGMEADLRQANRIKDEFLATLSHELRTPLTAILGWVHLLRTGRLDVPMSERATEVIERNAKAQSQLIADILDVSRIVTGKFRLEPRSVELASIVEAAVDAIRPAAEAKRIRLVIETGAPVGLITVDPDRLQQVVWNLLSNATKFTPEDGEVRLRLRRADARVEIEVEDTGAGIPPDLLPHVFDRFRQGDSSSTRAHGGLGLGLAIVRHIVELHGGTVEAANRGVGAGAVFRVAFPIRAAMGPVSEVTEPLEAMELTLEGVSVLVVDDDPDTLDLVATVLRQRGANVATASGAEEALQCMAEGCPDILLSDLAMPMLDGFELIRRARALPGGEGMRAAALSAYARTEDRLRALWAGFETHIPKPVQPSELAAVVASLAGRTGRLARAGSAQS